MTAATLKLIKSGAKEVERLADTLDVSKVSQLEAVRRQIKELQAVEKELKGDIEAYLRNQGVDKTEAVDEAGNRFQVIWESRDYSKLNEEKLEKHLRERGLWPELRKQVEVVDEAKLQEALEEGILSPEELRDNAMDISIRRALKVKALK